MRLRAASSGPCGAGRQIPWQQGIFRPTPASDDFLCFILRFRSVSGAPSRESGSAEQRSSDANQRINSAHRLISLRVTKRAVCHAIVAIFAAFAACSADPLALA
jgi:hypothetical protein